MQLLLQKYSVLILRMLPGKCAAGQKQPILESFTEFHHYGLSERLTIGRKEAKELIDGYFNSYPGVKIYMDESIKKGQGTGLCYNNVWT